MRLCNVNYLYGKVTKGTFKLDFWGFYPSLYTLQNKNKNQNLNRIRYIYYIYSSFEKGTNPFAQLHAQGKICVITNFISWPSSQNVLGLIFNYATEHCKMFEIIQIDIRHFLKVVIKKTHLFIPLIMLIIKFRFDKSLYKSIWTIMSSQNLIWLINSTYDKTNEKERSKYQK